jgi:hypothetical protein
MQPSPALAEEDVRSAEQRLGRRFPEDYRRFLLRNNGGKPVPECFRMRSLKDGTEAEGAVGWFFGLNTGNPNIDIEDNLRVYDLRTPSRFVPIATDPGGNLICLSTQGSDFGAVYFWDHESELDQGNVAGDEGVYAIAPAFQAFLEGLFTYDG